jgi:hypothetical protein
MNEYTAAIGEVDQFLNTNPTLAHQRRALGTNGRLADEETVETWLGEKLFNAGYKFLERIHQDIFLALPQHERNTIAEELDNLASGDKEQLLTAVKVDETGKPELTKEYLIAIGRPDMIEWGTDRQ